jgi:hypothetical protein
MVAISAPAKVLVTGANGYLATWVVKKYLEAGYSVRGTVRSLSKSAFLNDKFGHYGNRFELVVVDDITKDGAFDEAVKGVDVIAHTASPFHFNSSNPDGMSNFIEYLPRLTLGTYRSDYPCRAGNYDDLELRLETREHREACGPHLFGRRGFRVGHGATSFHGKQLEQCRRGGGKGEGLCSRSVYGLHGLEDTGRESCVGVRCRSQV